MTPILLGASGLVLVFMLAFSVYASWSLTHPGRVPLTSSPAQVGLAYQDITFPSRQDHVSLSGWWIPAPSSTRAVVLLHGYAANRGGFTLDVAARLHRAGFNVLMFDFRGEGRSSGSLVSFGAFERRDALGAVDYARTTGHCTAVGLLGYSMGAATAIMAAGDDPAIAGVVADSSYDDLRHHLETSLPYWIHQPAFPYTGLIMTIMPWMTGIDVDSASPLASMRAMGTRPVLLIAGANDQVINPQESRHLATASTDPNVSLWLVPGAGHIGAHGAAGPDAYDARIVSFFQVAFTQRNA